jgi:prevent-host-death family protein
MLLMDSGYNQSSQFTGELAMIAISLAEAKNRLSELLVKVENGEEISVTRRGRPVARIVPIRKQTLPERSRQIAEAFARLKQMKFDMDGDIKAIARKGAD